MEYNSPGISEDTMTDIGDISVSIPVVIGIFSSILALIGTTAGSIIKQATDKTRNQEHLKQIINRVETLEGIKTCNPEQHSSVIGKIEDVEERTLKLENDITQLKIDATEIKTAFNYTSRMINDMKNDFGLRLRDLQEAQGKVLSFLTELSGEIYLKKHRKGDNDE